ncbi:MAG: DNA N-6-adenine-methyltransferase [Planctomycetota bacterium]
MSIHALSRLETERFKQLEGIVDRGLKTFIKVGAALKEIRDNKFYRTTHRSFAAYVEDRFGFKRTYAHNLIESADAVENVQHAEQIANARQAVEVAKAPEELQSEVVDRAVEIAEERDTKPTAAIFAEARDEVVQKKPHVTNNSGQNEWYTPAQYVLIARGVMGGIDLDPATAATPQEYIDAEKCYTVDDDGLAQDWAGRVWLNPPYSKDLCSRFAEKLLDHFIAGDVTQAVVLVNNATDTAWFQSLSKIASAVCFPSGRIKFLGADGEEKNTPLQGQAFLYCGKRVERFAKAFEAIGLVATTWKGKEASS